MAAVGCGGRCYGCCWRWWPLLWLLLAVVADVEAVVAAVGCGGCCWPRGLLLAVVADVEAAMVAAVGCGGRCGDRCWLWWLLW